MRDLPASTATSRSSTARAVCRARTGRLPHASCVRRRPRRGVLASRGRRVYEELHAAGGGILSTVRRRGRLAKTACAQRSSDMRGWMLRHGTTTWEGKSGTASTATPSSPRCARSPLPEAFDVARRACGAAGVRRRRSYLEFVLAEVLPGGRAARGSRGRLSRARRVRRRTGSPLSRGVSRRRGSRYACTATNSRRAARSRSRSSSGRAPSTISRRPVTKAYARSRRVTSSACCFRRARCSSAGRCRPAG